MPKKGKLINFLAGKQERSIIDAVRKENYTMNQSDIIRMLMIEGAKVKIGEKKVNQILKECKE